MMGPANLCWLIGLWLVPAQGATPAANANANANANAAAGSDLPPLDRFFRHTLLPELRDGDGVWQGSPKLWRDVEGCDSPSLFSFDDAIAASLGGLLDRACVAKAEEALEGNWVSEYAPSKTADDLRRFLDRGTLFFNGAGLDFPHLADLAASCQAALGLPSNVNIYITKPGREVSVSPHTDMQDVLVFQTSGRKRWRVWAPPARLRGKDPFGRGKNGDRIDGAELGEEPLLDTWLEPGSVLYVPIGFPHATATVDAAEGGGPVGEDGGEGCADGDYSCHVTLNIDTYFYGICFATLRAIAAARAGSIDRVDPFHLGEKMHRRLFAPLPLGFLCPEALREDGYGEAFEAHVAKMIGDLNEEAASACGVEAPSLGSAEELRECIRFVVSHWRAVMTPSKYSNVMGPFPRLSIEAMQAKMGKDAKNKREEAEQKKLGAFASQRS